MKDQKIKSCRYCNDKGYTKDSETGTAVLCRCITKKCECNNDNNNMIYNVKSNSYKSCDCRGPRIKIKKINGIFLNSDIPPSYKNKYIECLATVDSSNKSIPHIQKLLTVIESVIENYSDPLKRKGILFWSESTGTGKTLAASIIANTLIYEHIATAKFLKLSSDYFGRLKNTYNAKADERERDIIKDLIDYDILIIDDFGTQRSTDWENEKLYELIDGRNDRKKITIITSNNNFENIEKEAVTDRIYSRLIEMCIIYNVKTPCYRQVFLQKL